MLHFDVNRAAKITIIDYLAKNIDKKSFLAHFLSIFQRDVARHYRDLGIGVMIRNRTVDNLVDLKKYNISYNPLSNDKLRNCLASGAYLNR